MSGFTFEVLTGFDHFLRAVKNQQPNTGLFGHKGTYAWTPDKIG